MFAIYAKAWAFVRKQSVFTDIGLLLLALPATAADLGIELMKAVGWKTNWVMGEVQSQTVNAFPLVVVMTLALTILHTWADAAVLTTSQKMLKKNVGRSRSSFRAVARQSRKFIVPLLFVSILWTSQTLLGLLFFIIPGIIIGTRTVFCGIETVIFNRQYGAGLRASSATVRGKTMRTFLMTCIIFLSCFVPAGIVESATLQWSSNAPFAAHIIATFFAEAVWAAAIIFADVLMVAQYGELRKHS